MSDDQGVGTSGLVQEAGEEWLRKAARVYDDVPFDWAAVVSAVRERDKAWRRLCDAVDAQQERERIRAEAEHVVTVGDEPWMLRVCERMRNAGVSAHQAWDALAKEATCSKDEIKGGVEAER